MIRDQRDGVRAKVKLNTFDETAGLIEANRQGFEIAEEGRPVNSDFGCNVGERVLLVVGEVRDDGEDAAKLGGSVIGHIALA
jgi:hypothetical protein